MRIHLFLSVSIVAACSFACLGNNGGGDGSDPTGTTTTTTGTHHTTRNGGGQACSIADDCPNIACICDDGSSLGAPVNARHCTNGSCDDANATCPGACSDFGYAWTGTVVDDTGGGGGGGCGGGGGGTTDTGASPGSSCDISDDCEAHDCECPDGFQSGIRECLDNVCQGTDLCADQCCTLGHGCP